MRSLSSLHSMPTSKVPAAISATTFSSLPLSLHAQIQILKTRKKPTLCKLAAKPIIDIVATPIKSTPSPVSPKKILVPIGLGTEEMEAVIMVGIFRRAGAAVTVASVEEKLEVEASGGTRLVADAFISACSDQIFDLIALPGGMPGSARLRDCKLLQNITTKQAQGNRLYGAICAAPAVTLLPWGLLRRKLTTCHPAFFGKLSPFWAVKSNLQVSGELTTSRGPGTSFEFALSLVEQLFGEAAAKEICDLTLLNVGAGDSRKEEFNEVSWSLDHIPQVLIPVANGSEVIEVVTIVDILRRAKANVVVASLEKSLRISGSSGTNILADKTISDAAESIYDLIILPGGSSSTHRLSKSRILKKLLKEQESAGRFFGALYPSPAILQKQGLLKDKRTTGLPLVLSDDLNGARVVIDGNIITSKGLSCTIDFALAIVSKLFGQARAKSVAEGLVFQYLR